MTGQIQVNYCIHRARLHRDGETLALVETVHAEGLFYLRLISHIPTLNDDRLAVVFKRSDALIFAESYLRRIGRTHINPHRWQISLAKSSGTRVATIQDRRETPAHQSQQVPEKSGKVSYLDNVR